MTGVGQGQAIDLEQLGRLVAPEHWSRVQSALSAALADGQPQEMECRLRRPDGGERWFAWWARAQPDRDGRIRRLVGMAQDISERHGREERLLLLSEAVEQSPAAVVITDVSGVIQYVNRRFTEITGYSRAEAMGRNPRFLQSGRTPIATYREMWDTTLAGGTWAGQLQNRRKDGSLYWEDAIICGIRDEGGRVLYLMAIKEDVTERREAQQSQALLRSLLDSLPQPLLAKHRDGRYLECNAAATALLGLRREQLLGRRDAELFGAESAVALSRGDAEALAGRSQGFRAHLDCPDGRQLQLAGVKSPWRGPDGTPWGCLLVLA
jgi:sigma-B regulation protein RsbU (phosphoserine phosphatase)